MANLLFPFKYYLSSLETKSQISRNHRSIEQMNERIERRVEKKVVTRMKSSSRGELSVVKGVKERKSGGNRNSTAVAHVGPDH